MRKLIGNSSAVIQNALFLLYLCLVSGIWWTGKGEEGTILYIAQSVFMVVLTTLLFGLLPIMLMSVYLIAMAIPAMYFLQEIDNCITKNNYMVNFLSHEINIFWFLVASVVAYATYIITYKSIKKQTNGRYWLFKYSFINFYQSL